MASIASGEFAGAGAKVGIEIWRIESLKVKALPTEEYGRFSVGDSYIVLRTKKKGNGLSWNLHFWLGSETTQDESGVAAYKSVELDNALGGGPVQFRECEGHESDQFLSYFKKDGGVIYQKGGVDSGFNHVERDSYKPRLLQLKGRRNVRVSEVELTCASLNEGDVFILDAGLRLFVWHGSSANRLEKAKGLEVVTRIRNERGAKPVVQIIQEEDAAEFWDLLGGKGNIASAESVASDEAAEKKASSDIKLFRVSDASGKLEIKQEASGLLKREMLDTNDTFILDAGSQIFVVGPERSESTHLIASQLETNRSIVRTRPSLCSSPRALDSG